MKITNLMGLIAAMALIACPGPSDTVDGGVTADGCAAVDGGGGGAGSTSKTGSILVTQSATQVLNTTYYGGGATASFGTTTVPAGLTNPCTTITSGSCTSVRCVTVDAGTGDAGPMVITTRESAGTITIAGSSIDGGITLAGSGTNIFTSRIWADGATLSASSTGAAVPAFSVKTVVVPGSTVVSCVFAASAGTGSVPVDLLSKFEAGSGYLIVGSSNATDFTAGDYAVKFQAVGLGALGRVSFQ